MFGSLIDGVFEGKILSPKGSYFVEKAHHYFPHSKHPNRTFHSVIYHEDHVQDPYAHQRQGKCYFVPINSFKVIHLRFRRNLHNIKVEIAVITILLGHYSGCGINDDVLQWMERIQYSGAEDLPPSPSSKLKSHKAKKHKKVWDFGEKKEQPKPPPFHEDVHNKYSREANEEINSRHRRATRRDENKNTCSLYIQTDPLIWKHIREGFPEVYRF